MNNEGRLKEIEKEFMKLGLIDAIPFIMLGVGVHAKYGGGELVFEFLKNDIAVGAFLGISIPIIVYCMFRSIQLVMERRRLSGDER